MIKFLSLDIFIYFINNLFYILLFYNKLKMSDLLSLMVLSTLSLYLVVNITRFVLKKKFFYCPCCLSFFLLHLYYTCSILSQGIR